MAATVEHWKTKPFGEIAKIPYRARFTVRDFEQLKLGLIPKEMEDKWYIYHHETFLAFHRSWTGQPVYKVVLEKTDDGAVVKDAYCSIEVISKSDAQYQARLLDFIVSNLLLGQSKPFPVPASISENTPGIYQHAIVGRDMPKLC